MKRKPLCRPRGSNPSHPASEAGEIAMSFRVDKEQILLQRCNCHTEIVEIKLVPFL